MKRSFKTFYTISNFLVGFGLGIILAALSITPADAASLPHTNSVWLVWGIVVIVVGIICRIVASNLETDHKRKNNIKELFKK